MKKNSIILLILIFSSCSIQNQNFDRKNEKSSWIFTFKSNVLKSCLIESYGDEFKKVLRNDQSISANSEVLSSSFFVFTDSLGMIVGKKNTLFNEGDFKGKKNTLNSCLFYYHSKELDSIANMQYKIYKKNN